MARCARTYLPGYPYYIVQRGNSRNACFVAPRDYVSFMGRAPFMGHALRGESISK
jgi:REP element-mobilizing transposase RayT